MSKLKLLVANHEKYIIGFEHKIDKSGNGVSFGVKAKLTIPSEGGMYSKQVTTDFVNRSSLADAEEAALDLAISRILGDKQTGTLVKTFSNFDISTSGFATGDVSAPVAAKVTIVITKDGEKNPVPYRIVSGLAAGIDAESAEKEALKSAVNKALGVK